MTARLPHLHPLTAPTLRLGCALLLAATLPAATPHLSPQPRELHLGVPQPTRSASITVPGGDPEDLFAAQNLAHALEDDGITVSPAIGTPDLTIRLLRTNTPEAGQRLTQAKLTFTPVMHDEGYVLLSQPGTITLLADAAAGLFYGTQTLKQLVGTDNTTPAIWTGTVRDWPAMRYRGVHDDLSRGPFPTLAYQKHQLDVFAAHKVNLYSPYFEHTLQYANDPLVAPPGSALTRAEAQELVAYAARLHIMVVPEQEAFGHLHHVLQYEKYADLAETPHGHVIAPGQPGSQPLIKSWFTQIADDFPSPFLHVGADETFELGTGRTRTDVEKRGLGPVYADFLSTIHTTLAPLHRRLLFWGDVAGTDPAAIGGLPKDMIAIPWIYWHLDSYDATILPFRQAGMETWVAPGDANWRVVYPNGATALDNIAGFVEAGQRLGSTGELTTVWNDDGEGLFDQDWFGVLFGAAAGWQPGKSDAAAYQAGFGQVFYGDTTGRLDEAQGELMKAATLTPITNEAFWLDPWSPEGQTMAAKWRTTLPSARLHAEHALELIESVRADNPKLREEHALAAMELGARRMDFIAWKFQAADEIAIAYSKAYALKDDKAHRAEMDDLLYSISSMNGRCQDLRDNYSMLKNLYRDTWLKENRPFWLDNVLVRYDLRIQLWQKRGEDINTLIERWQTNHTLPTATEAGLPAPPA